MSERLNDFEIKILEECAGLRKPSRWGAAVGAALEFLRGSGFVGREGEITDKGRAQILARNIANGCIITQATERFIYQIVEACSEHEREAVEAMRAKCEAIAREGSAGGPVAHAIALRIAGLKAHVSAKNPPSE